MKKKSYMNNNQNMNNSGNGKNKGLAETISIGLMVVAVIDLLIRGGYRIKGGGSVGTGKYKQSARFDFSPGKGTGPAGHVSKCGRGRHGK